MISKLRRCLRESLDVLGEDSPAGRRTAETQAFFQFYEEEVSGVLERWQERTRGVEQQ